MTQNTLTSECDTTAKKKSAFQVAMSLFLGRGCLQSFSFSPLLRIFNSKCFTAKACLMLRYISRQRRMTRADDTSDADCDRDFIRPISHSVTCNKLVRLLLSQSVVHLKSFEAALTTASHLLFTLYHRSCAASF